MDFQFLKLSFFLLSLSALVSKGAGYQLQPVLTNGLTLPLFATVTPGEPKRLYVVEQKGRIVIVENGRLLSQSLLDIHDKVRSGGEMGLLGLAFHPGFQKNHRYFVNYTTQQSSGLFTIVAEYQVGSPNEKVLLSFAQPFSNHNGGMLAFDRKGLLYISAGDGGGAGDPKERGQKKSELLGKILRIDVDRGSPYAIPGDNPFRNDAGARPEVYAYGLRNVWRFSFDRATDRLIASDVGQYKYEEIDIIERGKNYGWNKMEGKHCYKTNCDPTGLELPIFEYSHAQGDVSITGGYVYRGKAIPALQGAYLYADYASGRIWALHYDWDARKFIKNDLLLDTRLGISSFGEDADGEILVVDLGGGIYRLAVK